MSFPKQQQPIAYDDPNELINQVIATLAVPSETEETYVSKQYNNSKNDQNEIQAYAKIAGRDWTYFVKTLNVSIGRNTDTSQRLAPDQQPIAIDLGPSKVVSRKHAEITYNLNTRRWMLRALGRNGLKVDGVRVIDPGPNSNFVPLESGNIIDIGGTQMMFILPDCSPVIAKQFLDNLKDKKLIKNKSGGYDAIPNSNLRGFQIFNKSQINDGETHSSSPGAKIGEQDLSKDESKDIKPPFSYATMITQAILTNPEGILSLSEIYDWISSHYAYYRHSKTGWQNSIRHNLSLNKAFDKVPRKPNEPGKGMKWCIAPAYKNEFLKKWESGNIKSRRGSSVTRQLQLHLMKNKKLPDHHAQSYNTLKANPQLPQIRNVGSMPPPFQQAGVYQGNEPQLQPYPNFAQGPYGTMMNPLQQQQPQQQQQQQNNYALPAYLPYTNGNGGVAPGGAAAASVGPQSQQQQQHHLNGNGNGSGLNISEHPHLKLEPNVLSTPNRRRHQFRDNSNGTGTTTITTNGGPDSKLPSGLSSPQAPLSAERGGGQVNHQRHHARNTSTGGFGDFVYSSPTKDNNIDLQN